MADIWFISDTHFGHQGVCNFTREDDVTPLRPWDTYEEMDEALIANWNSVVKPQDKVYHLGDLALKFKPTDYIISILKRLNGHKRLIRGNHDMWPTRAYLDYFDEIYGVRIFHKEGLACQHIPMREAQLRRDWVNVHGHLHSAVIDNPRYISVCVEQINYTPISFDEVVSLANEGRKLAGI